jgi:hypothetical protein
VHNRLAISTNSRARAKKIPTAASLVSSRCWPPTAAANQAATAPSKADAPAMKAKIVVLRHALAILSFALQWPHQPVARPRALPVPCDCSRVVQDSRGLLQQRRNGRRMSAEFLRPLRGLQLYRPLRRLCARLEEGDQYRRRSYSLRQRRSRLRRYRPRALQVLCWPRQP